MGKKKADAGQLELVPMTKADHDHAARKFADLTIQENDLIAEKKVKLKRYNDDITEIRQTKTQLAESLKAYEAGRA